MDLQAPIFRQLQLLKALQMDIVVLRMGTGCPMIGCFVQQSFQKMCVESTQFHVMLRRFLISICYSAAYIMAYIKARATLYKYPKDEFIPNEDSIFRQQLLVYSSCCVTFLYEDKIKLRR